MANHKPLTVKRAKKLSRIYLYEFFFGIALFHGGTYISLLDNSVKYTIGFCIAVAGMFVGLDGLLSLHYLAKDIIREISKYGKTP